jgi:hypothetical protein
MALGRSDQSTDVVAGLDPALIQFGSAVCLAQGCYVLKYSFCRLAQGLVIASTP